MNYWLNIYKPTGISSAKVVAVVKRLLKGVKVGHAGTLDVEAEGVLPLAIGEATKLVSYLVNARKKYIFTLCFGASTDTGDASGNVIKTTNHIPSGQECYDICNKFVGVISQTPPAFSAIKVNGVRSYTLARQNNARLLKSRQIEIYNLECLGVDLANNKATYLAECSKGTYIRTLAEDIALSLQSLAFVVELRRTGVGQFLQDNAILLSELEGQVTEGLEEFLETKIIKVEAVLDDILVLDANEAQAQKIKYGQKCFFDHEPDIESVWIRYQGRLLAVGSISENCFNSLRVFNLI